jgi:cell division protein ZapA (FtsZ GTPase activity inhibitor)
MNEKFDIEVYRRRLTIEMEGMTQLEVNALAQDLSERMTQIEHRTNVPDSSKLAIITALEILTELQKEKDARSVEKVALERKVEEMSLALRASLTHAGKK